MPSTSSPDLLAGRYRLESVLGRGGMGEVRSGTDLRLDRPVAIKLLRSDLSDQVEIRSRFEREARAAARITHPNVVAVFDTGEDDGVPYIVMERLPGTTLADELGAGPCSESQACTTVVKVLSALDAAHQLGILHRDIKPGNILRGRDGDVKVADFGIAKIVEGADTATSGIIFATAAYLAPERLSGAPATPQSDLYSVGVVLYEALAGNLPFRADTPLGLVHAISSGAPPPLASLRPDVSATVIAVVERAMATAPDCRFDSAAAMADALQRVTHDPPSVENTPTLPVADVHAARSTRAAPVAPTEVLEPAPSAAQARPRTPTRHRTMIIAVVGALLFAAVVAIALFVLPGADDGEPATRQPSQTSASTIPADLRRAIDRLDQAVQP